MTKLFLAFFIELFSVVLNADFIEGLSESSSAALEDPSFEKQLVRINVGINLIRINTDIIENMPVSADSKWVEKVIAPVNRRVVNGLEAVRNDAYYSTVRITNAILRKPLSVRMSPLESRLYWQASVIYKNSSNGHPKYSIPDMNVFPDVSDTKTYTSFRAAQNGKKISLIDVEASSSNLHSNLEEAVISLLPEDMIESVILAKNEYRDALDMVGEAKSKIAKIETFLEDDTNQNTKKLDLKQEELAVAEAELEEREKIEDNAQERYFTLLENGAQAIEANFDPSKVNLAKRLNDLLEAVDNNAFAAASMFVSATAGMTRGYGVINKELRAIATAQALTALTRSKKEFITKRYNRMLTGTLLAVPNISIGTYYAYAQTSSIAKYQDIVDVFLSVEKER